MNVYLGIDLGSVSINSVLINDEGNLLFSDYQRTYGNPLESVKNTLKKISLYTKQNNYRVLGIGTTGSGRHLALAICGGGIAKNEITSHARGALHIYPNASTIIEIGGQDSKAIFINNGVVIDFSMNTVCAAGTGSFLDQQASRLNMTIDEFGKTGLLSKNPAKISGRCTVFAESDMIHKQQAGILREDIIMGLCEALVRNYISGTVSGRKIEELAVFQGGVAYNLSIRKAFKKELGFELLVPDYHEVMGAYGISLIAKEEGQCNINITDRINSIFNISCFNCSCCSHECEIMELKTSNEIEARWGGRCGRWK